MMSRFFLVQRKNRKSNHQKKRALVFLPWTLDTLDRAREKVAAFGDEQALENLLEAFRLFKLSPMEEESLLRLLAGPESGSEPEAQ
jgi:hypothetical protein